MERFSSAVSTFEHAIARGRQMVRLYDALAALRNNDPANDDALRAAYFQAVSSFDFFAHEIAAVEAKHRFEAGKKTRNISLPMELMTIADVDARISAAEEQVRQSNSFKAFVDPAKLAEMLSCFCENPWDRILFRINEGKEQPAQKTAEQVKGQLKSIWKRRNKIAHEADVNPALAGISLWPIDKQDAELTISFVEEIGGHLPSVISEEFSES